ncbi:hypothetical protein AVEN_218785-1 [Araneus ventricosus]|uniref:HTH psq-type domain-containing protein n=1 Tax=Araneus ventricosus TaxID=182803 RepID=A0A4Y2B6Y1_ARAVE|nr:hypothetical protein AVEN_218785-1 [Araneus ventricosus]
MGRTFKGKTDRTRVFSELMEDAVKCVSSGFSIRAIVKELNILKSALQRQIIESKAVGEESYTFEPNFGNRRIFTLKEEKLPTDYMIIASKRNYGLSTTQTRKLAYKYAKEMNKIILNTLGDKKNVQRWTGSEDLWEEIHHYL